MKLNIDGKEYRIWFEYKHEPVGHKKPVTTRAIYCYLSDPDETWRLVSKVVRFRHFSKIIDRKRAMASVLQMHWDRHQRREAWAQIFKQMKRESLPKAPSPPVDETPSSDLTSASISSTLSSHCTKTTYCIKPDGHQDPCDDIPF